MNINVAINHDLIYSFIKYVFWTEIQQHRGLKSEDGSLYQRLHTVMGSHGDILVKAAAFSAVTEVSRPSFSRSIYVPREWFPCSR